MTINFNFGRTVSETTSTDAIAEALLRSFDGTPTDDDVELLTQSYGDDWEHILNEVKESPFGILLHGL